MELDRNGNKQGNLRPRAAPEALPTPELSGVSPPPALKRYDNDPAKELSRQKLKSVIEAEILTHLEPKNARVFCLPGIDLQEVKSVYDPLGIPRENITACEHDPVVADVLEAQATGIRIHRGSVEEYFSDNPKDFDVISLDYTAPLRQEHETTVRAIIKNNSAKRYLVHQANSARRDRSSYGQYATLGSPVSIDSDPNVMMKLAMNVINGRDRLHAKGKERIAATHHRSNALTMSLYHPFESGLDSKDLLKLYQILGKQIGDHIISEVKAGVERDLIMPGDPKLFHGHPDFFFWRASWQVVFKNFLLKTGHVHEDGIEHVLAALPLSLSPKNAHKIGSVTRYAYTSESTCPMIGDIFVASKVPEAYASAKTVAKKIKRGRIAYNTLVELVPHIADLNNHNLLLKASLLVSEREFLGSSTKMLKGAGFLPKRDSSKSVLATNSEQDELSKEDAISLLFEDCPIKEILEAYPGAFTENQLRAYKAHITMGTYKQQ